MGLSLSSNKESMDEKTNSGLIGGTTENVCWKWHSMLLLPLILTWGNTPAFKGTPGKSDLRKIERNPIF